MVLVKIPVSIGLFSTGIMFLVLKGTQKSKGQTIL